jgi:hypothetical protein
MKVTNCSSCDKTIGYTTRKPRKCIDCKKATPRPRKKRGGTFPKNKGTKGEMALFYLLNDMLKEHDYINHGFYSFLMSPHHSPLQLDRFYPMLGLAFEYDGRQHDEYIKYIHKARKNFLYQQQCDIIKDKACRDRGITLIRISHRDKISEDLIRDSILVANAALYKILFGEE